MKVIKMIARASDSLVPEKPLWLKSYEDTPCGRGKVTFAETRDDALGFENFAKAFEYWRRQSATVPLRPDGKPNRPLTAFHAVIEER